MRFGEVPLDEAEGAILAHSHPLSTGRLRKGARLDADALARLAAEGVARVVVARPEAGDLNEDAAAGRIAQALLAESAGLRITEASTGRVNLIATGPGLLSLDVDAIRALNGIDPMVTLATLPPLTRVAEGTMVGTVKIISYAVPDTSIAAGDRAAHGAMTILAPHLSTAELLITDLGAGPGKGEKPIAARLERLGMTLSRTRVIGHETTAIAEAIAASEADLVLLLTASATSDPADVGPAGLERAGGTLTRFGMPVDPGNLLFYGQLGTRPVIGLPGCARSPALNGADWVLERIVCGLEPTPDDIAEMGVGGLLKESPRRPHPRHGGR